MTGKGVRGSGVGEGKQALCGSGGPGYNTAAFMERVQNVGLTLN